MKKRGNPRRKKRRVKQLGFQDEKAYCQAMHSRKRALSRYGIDLEMDEIKGLASSIDRGEHDLITQQSNRVSVYAVALQGQKIPVVYDSSRRTLVSFLPMEFFEQAGMDNPNRKEECL